MSEEIASRPAPSNVDELFTGKQTLSISQEAPPSRLESEPAGSTTRDKADDAPVTTEEYRELTGESEYESSETSAKSSETSEEDEYGNPVKAKAERMYTEAEVNEMIRKRLKRGGVEQPPESPYAPQYEQPIPGYGQNSGYEQPVHGYQPQLGHEAQQNEGDWEQQLESFVVNTLAKREQQATIQRQQYAEQAKQLEFERKFNANAHKYDDFVEVTHDAPITPLMIASTRGLENPATFIYAAAKSQAKELERISRLTDPYAVAVEMGRLEERMRKQRATTKAPAPLETHTSDAMTKTKPRNVDDIFRTQEKKRIR